MDASINTWMGNLVDSNQLLGIVHGCYGIGSLISPSLISYLLSKSNHPWKWQNYYVILSVVAGFCLVSLILKYETPEVQVYFGITSSTAKGTRTNTKDGSIELEHFTGIHGSTTKIVLIWKLLSRTTRKMVKRKKMTMITTLHQ